MLDRVPGVLPQHVRAHRLARHRHVVARAVPGRYQRVLDRAQADEWLSQGEPFPPPTEEEERAKKEREDAARAEEEAAAAAKEEEAKALAALSAEEREAKETQKKLLAEKKRVAEKAAAEKAKAEAPKETFSWESLNPLAALQKQMDEVFAMITLSQSILDEVAGGLERVAGGELGGTESHRGVSVRDSRLGLGVGVRGGRDALFRQDHPGGGGEDHLHRGLAEHAEVRRERGHPVRDAPSRHPARREDQGAAGSQGEGGGGGRAAAELANEDDDDASPSVVAASPAPPAPPSAPLAPLNVFFRMPTQSDRLL